jgi:hypothetical protein
LNTKEQRKITRWSISRQIKIKLAGEDDFVDCSLVNLNHKGLQLVFGDKVIEQDQFINLSILLDNNVVLDLEAWIVWRKVVDGQNYYGFYFTKIKDSDKDSLFKFVYKYAPQQVNNCWWRGIRRGEEVMQQAGNFVDKRIFARFPIELPLRFLEADANREGQAKTMDISSKGLGIVSEEKLLPNTPLEMWLKVPDKVEPFYTRGQVVWSQEIGASGFRYGVNLERADLMSLARNFKG